MAIIVEGDFLHAARRQSAARLDEFAAIFNVGIGRSHDAANFARVANAAPQVEQIGLYPHRGRLIKAGFEDAGGSGERGEVAAFVPGAASWPGDRGDDRDIDLRADRRADFRDQRGDHRASPVKKRLQRAIAARVGEPERLGHIRRKIDIAFEIGIDLLGDLDSEAFRVDAGAARAGETMLTKAKAQPLLQPAVGPQQRELVVKTMGIGRKAAGFEGNAGNGVILGDVADQTDGVSARRWSPSLRDEPPPRRYCAAGPAKD
jgi:hypothetical protein